MGEGRMGYYGQESRGALLFVDGCGTKATGAGRRKLVAAHRRCAAGTSLRLTLWRGFGAFVTLPGAAVCIRKSFLKDHFVEHPTNASAPLVPDCDQVTSCRLLLQALRFLTT